MSWPALFFFLFGAVAHSTIVRIDSLQEMAQNADIIAHVVVGDKSSSLDREGRVIELSTVQVLQGIKGTQTGHFLTLYQVAGIIGQSQFPFGEEMVIFGMRHGDKVVSYGVGLGKFKVLRGQNRASVVEEFRDLLTPNPDLMLSEPVGRRYSSLPNFVEQIQSSMNAPFRVVPTGVKALRPR